MATAEPQNLDPSFANPQILPTVLNELAYSMYSASLILGSRVPAYIGDAITDKRKILRDKPNIYHLYFIGFIFTVPKYTYYKFFSLNS
jgi:hypothetical protein